MALTKDSQETIKARADREPEFRAALFKEAVMFFLDGDVETGKAVLCDYINATIGFESLALKVGISTPSLIRMLSPKGNPTTTKLLSVIRKLQKETGIEVGVSVTGC